MDKNETFGEYVAYQLDKKSTEEMIAEDVYTIVNNISNEGEDLNSCMASNQELSTEIKNEKSSQSNKKETIKNIVKFITKSYSSPTNNSYYNVIKEYIGVIDTVDLSNNTFNATLYLANNNDALSVEFNIDDTQFESDKSLIKVGAPIVWVVGQETDIKEKIEEEANEWQQFFNEYKTTDKT